jgi:ribosomal protein L37AE/L43A
MNEKDMLDFHTHIYGPGDDDYGRDNMYEDWECPNCHVKSKFTRRDIRIGIWKCPNCGWLSKDAQHFADMIDHIKRDIDKRKIERDELTNKNFSSRIKEKIHKLFWVKI